MQQPHLTIGKLHYIKFFGCITALNRSFFRAMRKTLDNKDSVKRSTFAELVIPARHRMLRYHILAAVMQHIYIK